MNKSRAVVAMLSVGSAFAGAVFGEPASVSFARETQTLAPIAGRGVGLADFNGDGFLDAFVVADNTPECRGDRVYFGDGHGRFLDSGQVLAYDSVYTHRPALGDIDGDGDIDVIACGCVWFNDGHGRFTVSKDAIAGEPLDLTSVALADVDRNGTLDLVAISGWKALRVLLNDGKGHFRLPEAPLDLRQGRGSAIFASFAVADFDQDGVPDLVTIGWRNNSADACPNQVWVGDGQGGFRATDQLLDEGNRHVHGVAAGDVNGDGAPDIVLATTVAGHAAKIWLNDGRGHFRDSGQKLGDRWAHAVLLGDLNGDGAPDLFLVCGDPQGGTPNQVFLNDGKGRFTDSGLRLGRAFSFDGALGDFDRDGRLDVFVANLRVVDDSKTPPIFGGAPGEVWMNRTGQTVVH